MGGPHSTLLRVMAKPLTPRSRWGVQEQKQKLHL